MIDTPEERSQHGVDVESPIERPAETGERVTTLQRRAARIQHAMNNPLAALLAEGQLLAMENSLSTEQRDSVERMIELTRRLIHLVRDLDDLRGKHPPR